MQYFNLTPLPKPPPFPFLKSNPRLSSIENLYTIFNFSFTPTDSSMKHRKLLLPSHNQYCGTGLLSFEPEPTFPILTFTDLEPAPQHCSQSPPQRNLYRPLHQTNPSSLLAQRTLLIPPPPFQTLCSKSRAEMITSATQQRKGPSDWRG